MVTERIPRPQSPRSSNIKLGLLVAAVIIMGMTLYYSQRIVRQLQQREQQVAKLYAHSLEYIATEQQLSIDYSFIFDQIIRSIDFPMILTDANNNPLEPFSKTTRNIDLDTNKSAAEQEQHLRGLIASYDREHRPLRVTVQDSIILNYVHYGESSLVKKLRWLPYVEFGIAGLFIIVAYIGFSYIKRTEQSNIWVGMARETAHQLGTPLSSLSGWIELLHERVGNDSAAIETIVEAERDLQRLEKIAQRFSKIGSKPDLKEERLNDVIESVIAYFRRRIPQTGKDVELRLETDGIYTARVNRELFEWVLENLVKNGLDAIDTPQGMITFTLTRHGTDIIVDVTDTGRGIDQRYRRDIFRPGFSTKKRGWGLGLSLAKRIIDQYHGGKLLLKDSRVGKGTTFRIRIPS